MKMVWRWVIPATVAYVVAIICWSVTPAPDRVRGTAADAFGTFAVIALTFAGVAAGLVYGLGSNASRSRRRPQDDAD